MRLALVLTVLASLSTAARAQSGDACAAAAAHGVVIPNCQQLVNSVAGANAPGRATPPTTHHSSAQGQTPTFNGVTPVKNDCDAFGDAFDVIGSFTNYSFWMTGKDGQVAERLTLHGIYIEDASQNAEDAIAKANASVGAGEGCGALDATANMVAANYKVEFDLLTAALQVCAMDVTATKWKDCPGRMEAALKMDDQIRQQSLAAYLGAVDSGHQQCLSTEDRAFFEEMRLRPCQRGSNWAESNRCSSSRYGLATGRIGQLGKVRGLLAKINPSSVLGNLAQTASERVGHAKGTLQSIVDNPSRDNVDLFKATFEVYSAQKMLEAGKNYCR